MTSEKYSTVLMSRALDRKRGTSPDEKSWRDGYIDGASSILGELEDIIKYEKMTVPPSIKDYIKQFKEE